MPNAIFSFPKSFLWGTATSSHQVEGNNINNNWSLWEQEEGRIAERHVSGLACDWWGGRWKEDFDRAAEAGQNGHRLSLEWSRIQPDPGRWDESALDYYRQMIRGLHDRGLKPMVTLHHFTDPIWLQEMGGWENDKVVDLFSNYVDKVVEALGGLVDLWCTINEPNVYAAMGYFLGEFPPGKHDLTAAYQVMTNMVKAHGAAYHRIRDRQPDAEVGIVINWRGFHPGRQWLFLDSVMANFISRVFNDFFPTALFTGKLDYLTKKVNINNVKGTQDFIGLNYYTSDWVSFDLKVKEQLYMRRHYRSDLEVSPTGFIANYAEDFMKAMKWASHFGLPIYITENGTEDSHDDFRRKYLVEHIHQLWRGVNFNYPIKGYFHWSLVDNFEWDRGWVQRFGLWELDIETQARRKRPSVDLYAAICQENGLSSQMVREFAPQVFEKLFPG